MKKLLILGALVFTAVLFAGVQITYAWPNVNEGCTGCHSFPAGGGLHTKSGHSNCSACHTSTPAKGNVPSGKCAGCHPQESPGKCNLANISSHPKTGAQSCISCHCAATTTTTIPSGAFCTDKDKDTYGDNCTAGPDCDDADNTTHEGCGCIDDDGDGYGDNCTLGPDCDDNDNTTHEGCEIDCVLTVRPKTFTVLRAVLSPLQFFTIRAERQSTISFSNPICIFWSSDGIDDRVKIRIGEKLIIGYIQVYPTHLTAGDFKVYVTFGDISETQCGTIEVK